MVPWPIWSFCNDVQVPERLEFLAILEAWLKFPLKPLVYLGNMVLRGLRGSLIGLPLCPENCKSLSESKIFRWCSPMGGGWGVTHLWQLIAPNVAGPRGVIGQRSREPKPRRSSLGYFPTPYRKSVNCHLLYACFMLILVSVKLSECEVAQEWKA